MKCKIKNFKLLDGFVNLNRKHLPIPSILHEVLAAELPSIDFIATGGS